jgi:quinoprotein glucose dehydrogenase
MSGVCVAFPLELCSRSLRSLPSGSMGQSGAKNGDWRFYGGDAGSTKYSPLDQINRDNVKDLRIAWRWRTENFGARPDFNLESTPLMVDGVLYATAGARRNVVAINGVTGETLWMWRYDEGTRAQRSPRFNSGRGVAHWTDGKDARILYITPGYRLIALDAKSGRPSAGFGVDGIVDLWEDFDQPSPKEGQIGSSSPPMIVGDVAIVGAAMQAGGAPNKENVAGHVRGYDVRTGKRVWIFHTVPKPGEFGHDTWLDHSASYTGNTAVWAPMSADLELGYVYLPVETPTGDFYGGHRPGNNLFGDSIVCLDARTGKLVWHFQFIHHDIWDYDTPTAPTLIDITVDGRPIKAVAQITKQAWVYVFDRVTGKPVWPVEERPVPKGDVPGEWYSPTQPFPTKPAPFDRQGVTVDDLIDFTPELKAEAIKIAEGFKTGPIYTPPIVAGANGRKALMMLPYAGNWQGGAVDPETGILYVASITDGYQISLHQDPKRSNMNFISSSGPTGGRARDGCRGDGPQGLPLFKPPWGRITAIDLNTGQHVWMVPNGDTPDCVKNHPALQGVTLPQTGGIERAGLIVTKTLLLAGEGGGVRSPSGPLSGGPIFRAYDKKTREVIAAIKLPLNQTGIPMTYMANNKQYIVVPSGAIGQPAEFLALSLP